MRTSVLLLSVIFGLASVNAQVPTYVPTNGLLGWWPFNGNANDESGNGYDGVENGVALTNDRNGLSESAYNFDGVDDDIVTTLETISGDQHTISCWFKTSTSQSMEIGLVISRTTWNVSGGLYLFNNIQYLYSVSDCSNFNYAVLQVDSLNDGLWHHYVGVYDGGTMLIYVDGFPVAVATPGVQQCIDGNFTFGNDDLVPNRRFQGTLDDIGIWDRALSEVEIQSVYNAPPTSPCLSTFPVSFSGLASGYSLADPPVTLAGTPAGGVFIGPGVTGSSFDPSAAGVGSHGIIYTYVDTAGCVNSYAQCSQVDLNVGMGLTGSEANGVWVYPNPNRGVFTVELDLKGLVSIQVYDAKGALLQNEVFTSSGVRTQRTFDLSAQARGSYTIQVQHLGNTISQRVVIE